MTKEASWYRPLVSQETKAEESVTDTDAGASTRTERFGEVDARTGASIS